MAKFIELALTALQFQAEGLLTIGDILFSSRERTRRWFYRIPTEEQRWFKENWADLYRDRQQFYRALNHLKKQGLVIRKKKKEDTKPHWALTERGRERDQKYRESRRDPFSPSHTVFPKPQGNGITIIAYDIPERERRKRDWVRECLVAMECEQIQKSVWVSRGPINEDFVHALRERNLLGNIHIFAVTKHGTIKSSIS